jgi:hypothetical protein
MSIGIDGSFHQVVDSRHGYWAPDIARWQTPGPATKALEVKIPLDLARLLQ